MIVIQLCSISRTCTYIFWASLGNFATVSPVRLLFRGYSKIYANSKYSMYRSYPVICNVYYPTVPLYDVFLSLMFVLGNVSKQPGFNLVVPHLFLVRKWLISRGKDERAGTLPRCGHLVQWNRRGRGDRMGPNRNGCIEPFVTEK